MKELIPMDKDGIFADTFETARVNSHFVADLFGKEHQTVLQDIQALLSPDSGLSEEFREFSFMPSTYFDNKNQEQPCNMISRDGFVLLVMGYTGKKAKQIKEVYKRRFHKMEQFIITVISAKTQFPKLTKQIRLLYPDAKADFYSNECDMIHLIVLGMTADQYRASHGLDKYDNLYPHLHKWQVAILDMLQSIDMGLLMAVSDYQQRKRHLEWYAMEMARSFTAPLESFPELPYKREDGL